MSYTYTTSIGVRSDGGAGPLSGSCIELGNIEQTVDLTLAAGTVNQSVAVAFTVAALQSFFMVSDQVLVIKTNSTSSPGNTITLNPGRPYPWNRSDNYYASPFTVDVTVLYLSSTVATRVRMHFLKT